MLVILLSFTVLSIYGIRFYINIKLIFITKDLRNVI